MPPSTQTSVRPSTASTIPARASAVATIAIELAGAVVRHDDPGHPVLDREAGVLGGEDPLEHDRERRPCPDRREVRPRQAAIERPPGGCRSRRRDPPSCEAWSGPAPSSEVAVRRREVEAGSQVPLAVPEDRQVDRHDDRPVAGRRRPLDEPPAPARIGLGVELEPADPVGRRGGDGLDRGRRHRRQRERDARRGRGPGRRQLGVRMGEAVGRHRARSRRAATSPAPSIVVDGSTRETSTRTRGRRRRRRQRLGRLAQGLLVPRAAGDVVERGAVQPLGGDRLEGVERDDPARGRGSGVGGRHRGEPTRPGRGSRGSRASSCGRRAGSLNATVISSSLRVSFEVTTIPSPQRPWRTRSPSRYWRSPGIIGRGGSHGARRLRARRRRGRRRASPTARHPRTPRASRRGRGSAGTARPAAARRACRSPGDRPRRRPVPDRPAEPRRPARAEGKIHVDVETALPPARSGPTISSAGISSRNRDGTDGWPIPHVARRQAWERIEPAHRPRHPDVREPALLLELLLVVERPAVREDAFLEPGDEDDRELEALGRVERDQRHRVGVALVRVLVGDERRLLEQPVERVLRLEVVVAGRRPNAARGGSPSGPRRPREPSASIAR